MPSHDVSAADPATDDDPLQRERTHLAESRTALAAMRADAEALDITDVTGNWVNRAVLAGELERRIAALADLAGLPLFFGRLDYLHEVGAEDGAGHRFYIGRRHVHDATGDPMVIDWRAPVAQPFYQASPKNPMDVRLRRRFGSAGGELTAYEDEYLAEADPETPLASALLTAEIERPRIGPMRDIVATIQPEQDEIVRTDVGTDLCVQGAPGTGKTAVGLHRIAYLLYAHRDRLARTGTLVVGPNRSFLRYIEQVLPALGELAVAQTTVDELVAHVPVRGADSAATAGVKGDARMAEVLRRAVRSGIRPPEEPCMVVRGSRRWRVPGHELAELVQELVDRDIRYNAGRAALPQRIAHAVLVRMEQSGEAPDDRVQDAVARNPAVKAVVKAAWPQVDPVKTVFRLLGDREFLAECADGLLTEEEQQALLWAKPARSPRGAAWSAADAVLVDEVRDLLDRTHSLGHVVLDEAQDLSPMQYRAVGRRCTTGSVTVLGDLAQGTTPWSTRSWREALRYLGKSGARVEELTQGFRVPREIIDYASLLLPAIAPELAPASSVRGAAGSLTVRQGDDPIAESVAESEAALKLEGSVGLIAPDALLGSLREALAAAGAAALSPGEETSASARLTLVPAGLAKGLEYDHVVLAEPSAIVAGEPDTRTGLRRLYVCLTRAVSGLTVVHADPLPGLLA